ncbi:MAG: LPS-assembly protein LptD [Verrucomicrobia bacterium]|nr:LPS-assembly protein LptD [Verrucomicrobiota bacterium]
MRTLQRKALPIIVGVITGLSSLLHVPQSLAQLDEAAKKLDQVDSASIDKAAGMANQAAQLAQNLEIQSDETTFDEDLGIAKANGNVEIHYGGTIIQADHAEYHQSTGDVFARGNVIIYKDGGTYTAEEAIYNLNTEEMTASSLRGALVPIYYDADDIQIPTSATDMIEMTDSWFTTDDNAEPSFRMKAKRIRVYPGERVTFKNMKFYAGNTPIMWLPYLSQPLNDELGYFFTPGYNSGWGGFLLNQYGFMLGEGTLAQAQFDLRSSRGIAGGIEFKSQRYRNNINFGRLKLYYASDDAPNTNFVGTERNTDLSGDRYRINLQHRVYFPGPEKSTLYLDIDINALSDAFVYSDFFPREFTTDPKPDNIINLVKSDPRGTLSLTGRLQLNDFFQTDSRLPELALDVTRQPILGSGFFYQGYTTFGILEEKLADSDGADNIQLRRAQDNYLKMIDAGKAKVVGGDLVSIVGEDEDSVILQEDFDEDASRSLLSDLDLLLDNRSFTRFDTYHEVLYPTAVGGWLSLVPRAGVGYTKYFDMGSKYVGNRDRTTFHAGIDASFKVSKVYQGAISQAMGINEIRHIAQPYVNYSFVSADAAPDGFSTRIDRLTPSTRLRPLDLPLFTAVDDIRSWNIARTGMVNRIQTKRNQGTHGWLEVNTFFDTYLDDPEFDRNFSNLFNNIIWAPLPWLNARVNSQIPVFNQTTDFTEITSSLTFMPVKNFQFSLGNYFLNDHPFFIDSNLYTFGTYTRLNENWGFSTSHRFEQTDNTLEIQQYQIHRDLSAWTASFGGIIRDSRRGDEEWGVVMSFTLKAFPRITLPIDLQPGSFGGAN